MPQQIKRRDLGTGPFVEVKEEVIGEEIPTNFIGEEIPADQWEEDEEGNVIISPALSFPAGQGLGGLEGGWVGEEITQDGLPKYKDGVFTYEGFREWEDEERKAGRDGFWHWLTVTLPEGSKEAFSYLYGGTKEMPDKFKEDPLKAMAIFPEAALSAGEGWGDIASGAVDLAKRPFRTSYENAEARYDRYKKFAERTKRILEERKSRVGDAIRAFGYLTDSDLKDYASSYDEGINPASADALGMIMSPDTLFGGSLYRTGARLAGKPATQANKALNNALKGINQGTGKKFLNVAKEVMKRPVTATAEGLGKATAGVGRVIEGVGEKVSALGAPGRIGENFPQLVKGAGEMVKLPGTTLKSKGQIVSVIGEAARKGGRRQTGLSVVKKRGDLVKPLQKAVEMLDTPLADRILRNAGDLADKGAKGAALGTGLGYVAGGKEGAAAGAGMGVFGAGMGFAGEKAAKYAPFVRNKFKGAERLKLDEEFVTEYAATLPEAERKAFLNPDRRMSVSDLAAEADAAQLFQGFQRQTGQNIDIKYVDGDGMVKAATSDPANPNHNARYQYGAFVPKWDSDGKPISRTIYINTDVSGSSRNRTLFHELFHPTEYFGAPREKKKGVVTAKLDELKGRPSWEAVDPFKDIRAELEQSLFGTFDSAGNRRSDGLYTEKQMLDFENQYLDAVYQLTPGSPQGRRIAEARRIREKAITEGDLDTANKASFAINELQKQRQSNIRAKENYLKGDIGRRRKNITSEILSENFANFGEKAHFGLLREAKKTLLKDKFKGSSLKNRLAKLSLSTLGKMRQVLAGKGVTFDGGGRPKGDIEATSSIFIDPLTGEKLVNSPETEHLLAQYIVALDAVNKRLSFDTGRSVDLFENAKDLKAKGRDGLTPEKERQLREIGWLKDVDSSGIPVFSTARERNKWHKENVAKVIDVLNSNPEDDGEPKMWQRVKTKKGLDRWEGGIPSEKQMAALRNSDIDPSYVRKIEMIRNAILKGDGTVFGNDYYKALTGGKYDSRASVKFRLIVPFALEATQAGNINIKSFNLSKLEDKINHWQTSRPKFFEEWGGDTDAFRRDVIDFFQGPSRGQKFPEGKKKDLIYQFMQIGNQRNPLSGEFVEKSGGMIESNRIERSTNLQPYDNLDKIPFNYGKMLGREYMPEGAFMPAPGEGVGLKDFIEDVQDMRNFKPKRIGGFDGSFHFNTKLMEIWMGLGNVKDVKDAPAPKGNFTTFDIELSPKAKEGEKFLSQQMADFAASLPEKKAVDLRTGSEADPLAITKKHFPGGEKGDLSTILRNMSDFAEHVHSSSKSDGKIVQSRIYNLAELLDMTFGITVDPKVENLISSRAYGKPSEAIKKENAEAFRQMRNPEFKDVRDLGEGSTLSTDIRFMPPPAPDTPQFKRFFEGSKVVDAKGKPLVVYSGHGNAQLWGTKWDKQKGTAGGFYATEDPAVASSYATGKLGSREFYEEGSEYRFPYKNKRFGKKIWQIDLTPEQQKKAVEFLEERGYDINKYWRENSRYDAEAKRALLTGGTRRLSNIHKFMDYMGDTIKYRDDSEKPRSEMTLPERLESEGKSHFEDLMDFVGIKWNAFDKQQPGVFPMYLSIKNPLDANKPFPKEVLADLKKSASRERPKFEGEYWTRDLSLKEFVDEIESGSEFWSTQVPTKAKKIFQRHGYDGIKELGNKSGEGDRQVNWIAFEPEQIKSVLNRGEFSPESPDIRFMPAPAFYSKAERAVEGAKGGIFNKEGLATIDQAKSLFVTEKKNRKEYKVPEAELEWSGVLDWLEARKGKEPRAGQINNWVIQQEAGGDRKISRSDILKYIKGQREGKVSKAELLEFLQNKGVKVEEVARGRIGADLEKLSSDSLPEAVNNIYDIYRADDPDGTRYGSIGQLTELNEKHPTIAKMKYGKGQPFVLNLSLKDDTLTFKTFEEANSYIQGVTSETLFRPGEKWTMLPGDEKAQQSYGELVLTLPKERGKSHETFDLPGGHRFPEENILAHIRFTERVDADGKKMLFLEEVQSDWNKAIRDLGIRTDRPAEVQKEIVKLQDKKRKKMKRDLERLDKELKEKYSDIPTPFHPDSDKIYTERRQLINKVDTSEIDKQIAELEEKYPVNPSGAPDMPYKGGKWEDLVLKRMMRWAADNGFDRLGWITGKDTAERYNLQKEVSSIRYFKKENGEAELTVTDKEGRTVFDWPIKSESDIEQHLGKNLASKLLTKEPLTGSNSKGQHQTYWLEGDDLAISPEWAINLYDRALPNKAKKLVKKKGAVGVTRLGEDAGGKKRQQLDQSIKQIEEQIRQGTEILESVKESEEHPGWLTVGDTGGDSPFYTENNIRDLPREILARKNELKELRAQKEELKSPEANYVDITPEVKALAEEGFSYFMPAGSGRGRATAPTPTGATLPATPIMPRVRLTEEEKEDSRRLLNLLKKKGI